MTEIDRHAVVPIGDRYLFALMAIVIAGVVAQYADCTLVCGNRFDGGTQRVYVAEIATDEAWRRVAFRRDALHKRS